MHYATACVVCAGQLPPKTRADCRYCGVRCRARAYRIRSDGGGRLRSDAQRRDYHDLQNRLRDVQGRDAEREQALNEASEWATLLEEEEAPLRAECAQLRQDLVTARQAAKTQLEELAALQAASALQSVETTAKLAEVQTNTENAAEELQRTQDRLAQVEQTLQAERATRQQTEADLSQRCADAGNEVVRLTTSEVKQRQEFQNLRDDHARIAKDRLTYLDTIQRFQMKLMGANQEIAKLRDDRAALEQQVASLQRSPPSPPADLAPPAPVQPKPAQSTKDLARLRSTVDALRDELATAKHQNAELSSQVQGLHTKLETAEKERSSAQTQADSLRAELEKAQARIREWTHGEISQIGIAVAQEAAKVAAVYFVTKTDPNLVRETLAHPRSPVASGAPATTVASFPARQEPSQPGPMPSSARATSGMPTGSVQVAAPSPASSPTPSLPPAAKPQALDEDQVWHKRIRDAKQQGWTTFGDQLFIYKRDVLKDQDRLAKEQLQRGVAITAKRLPEGADLEYLGIRAAIDARVAYHRQHGGRWEIEYFRLAEASETKLRRDAMRCAMKARRA